MKQHVYSILLSVVLFMQASVASADFNPNKWYRIQPLGNDRVWDVPHNNNKAQVYLHPSHGRDNQQFVFKKTQYNTWTMHPKSVQHKLLDIQGGSEENGASLLLFDPHRPTHKNQEFTLTRIGGPLYRIQNLKSGLSLCFNEDGHVIQALDYTSASIVELIECGDYAQRGQPRWQEYRIN